MNFVVQAVIESTVTGETAGGCSVAEPEDVAAAVAAVVAESAAGGAVAAPESAAARTNLTFAASSVLDTVFDLATAAVALHTPATAEVAAVAPDLAN